MDFDFNAVACNADSLLVAGSETTATTLIAATYLLATRLAHEVRTTFKTEDEITLTGVNGLPYMLACLQEAMRCYPPPIMGMPRQVGRGGGIIAGTHVPEDVSCLAKYGPKR
jgi:cytochrome P450